MPRTEEAFKLIREERRQDILKKAAQVFAEKGLANTKINDIAEAAGISQGLLYRYYTDKEAVFTAVLENGIGGVLRLTEKARQQSGTAYEKLYWLTDHFVQGIMAAPVYFRIFTQALAVPGGVRETIRSLRGLRDTLLEIIRDGQSSGEFTKGDAEELALLYLACLYGLCAGVGSFSPSVKRNFPKIKTIMHILEP